MPEAQDVILDGQQLTSLSAVIANVVFARHSLPRTALFQAVEPEFDKMIVKVAVFNSALGALGGANYIDGQTYTLTPEEQEIVKSIIKLNMKAMSATDSPVIAGDLMKDIRKLCELVPTIYAQAEGELLQNEEWRNLKVRAEDSATLESVKLDENSPPTEIKLGHLKLFQLSNVLMGVQWWLLKIEVADIFRKVKPDLSRFVEEFSGVSMSLTDLGAAVGLDGEGNLSVDQVAGLRNFVETLYRVYEKAPAQDIGVSHQIMQDIREIAGIIPSVVEEVRQKLQDERSEPRGMVEQVVATKGIPEDLLVLK